MTNSSREKRKNNRKFHCENFCGKETYSAAVTFKFVYILHNMAEEYIQSGASLQNLTQAFSLSRGKNKKSSHSSSHTNEIKRYFCKHFVSVSGYTYNQKTLLVPSSGREKGGLGLAFNFNDICRDLACEYRIDVQ